MLAGEIPGLSLRFGELMGLHGSLGGISLIL
jgi:hypothetical protein